MRWKKWMGLFVTGLYIGLAGCSTMQENQASTPTPPAQQDISGLFEEVEQKEIDIDTAEGDAITGHKEVLEKIDTEKFEKYKSANRLKSNIIEEDLESLFCIDPETGVAYFVNQNRDWFIYRIKENSVEVVVELPARELCSWDGVLYFIVDDYGEYELAGVKKGEVYSYTPATGEIKLVYYGKKLESARDSHMAVNENGINFVCNVLEKIVVDDKTMTAVKKEYNCLPFGSSELIEDSEKAAENGWGDYYFNLPGTLKHRTDKAAEAISLEGSVNASFLVGDECYAMNTWEEVIYVKNLASGELKSYDCGVVLSRYDAVVQAKEMEFEGRIERLRALTVTEDYIWAIAYSTWLVRIEPESGEMECYRLMDDADYTVDKLYTDGQGIYALLSMGGLDAAGFIVQIHTDEIVARDESYNDIPVLKVEYLTK